MTKTIYLDYHATTPVDPRVLDAMLPFFGAKFGNAASGTHSFGWEAEGAVEVARQRIADLAGAGAREIVFTSGATESNNLALKGVVAAAGVARPHIVTLATEHKAVLDAASTLEGAGCRVTVLRPKPDGLVDLDQLREAIGPETVLVSVMYANNEIGVLQPVRQIGEICREKNVLFHCDAVQAFGKFPVSVDADHIDLMSVSAHKMYGPKGVGALYVRRQNPRVRLTAQMDGGGHEGGMRSGTLNVPGIVGFGEACVVAAREMAEEYAAPGGFARPAEAAAGRGAGWGARERFDGAPVGGQSQRELSRRGRRCAAGGAARSGGLHGQRLQLPRRWGATCCGRSGCPRSWCNRPRVSGWGDSLRKKRWNTPRGVSWR